MENPPDMPWPHAPPHHICIPGTYFVTAATYQKTHYFNSAKKLTLLHDNLLLLSAEHNWRFQAWAVFSNHYHFVAQSPQNPESLRQFLAVLHYRTAKEVNLLDGIKDRKVWWNFWDTNLTFHTSYLARLKYVHTNPVHHGLVNDARSYPWCSASWFANNAPASFRKAVLSFDISKVKVYDEFDKLENCQDLKI